MILLISCRGKIPELALPQEKNSLIKMCFSMVQVHILKEGILHGSTLDVSCVKSLRDVWVLMG